MVLHTKIVCTLGPATREIRTIQNLILAGMNVARLNFSHGTHEEHQKVIEMVKQLREKLGMPVAIMLDTKGPEIRLGKLKNDKMDLKDGQRIWLVKEDVIGDEKRISLTPPSILSVLQPEMFVLLDNGYIVTHVVEVSDEGVCIEVDHGGLLRSTKGVNIPGIDMELPSLTKKDMADIKFGCEMDVDIIAASFIRTSDDVIAIRKLIEMEERPDINIISKIESREGVRNFDSILDVSDGIMVARGDLGVELPLNQVPRLQKKMIRECYLKAKTSVTATQMLESMITNPRPTRAEASDVANAIYDSTSAVMLSGETAIGRYPIEVVKVMRSIIEETELDFDYNEFIERAHISHYDVAASVAYASVRTSHNAQAKAIFAFTTSGSTARLLARLRPRIPIIAMTPNKKVYHQLALWWGVIPLFCDEVNTIEDAYKRISHYALEKNLVQHGDLVVITAGTPFGKPGTTNMMIVDSIGDVLVQGSEGRGERIHGKVTLFPQPEGHHYNEKGRVVVLDSCNEGHNTLLKNAAGVILQEADPESEKHLMKMAKALKISYVLRAKGASEILRNEQLITLDPKSAAVYKGAYSWQQ
ncbi:MAG: pyruvate kinase [Chlamydiales bacterium]|nr:pyruvate kinase [Chlamydiales bacterium]